MSGTESRLQQIKAQCEALVETMIWASRNVHPVEPAAFLADQVRRLAASCADLCEVLLDSGLLDQANEGGGEVQRIASVMNPSISDEGLGTTVPQPPASVEGVVMGINSQYWDAERFAYVVVDRGVPLPNSWLIGTKVRIERISE